MNLADKIRALQAEADAKGMLVDWEAVKLVPKRNPFEGMNHYQRDAYAKKWQRDDYYKYLDKDNDPASPEQAGW